MALARESSADFSMNAGGSVSHYGLENRTSQARQYSCTVSKDWATRCSSAALSRGLPGWVPVSCWMYPVLCRLCARL